MAVTLSAIRAAIGTQLRANIDREVNVDVDGKESPPPVVRLVLDSTPEYYTSMGSTNVGLSSVRFRLEIEPGNADQSAVQRLDDLLSIGSTNCSSVIGALFAGDTLADDGYSIDVAPGPYDYTPQIGELMATLFLTVTTSKD